VSNLENQFSDFAPIIRAEADAREAKLKSISQTLRSLKGQNDELAAREILFKKMFVENKIGIDEFAEKMRLLEEDMTRIHVEISQATVQIAYN
jgi:uncharacterized protein YaaN involved in tellurite resistance